MGKRDNGIAEQKQLIERRYIYEFKKHEKMIGQNSIWLVLLAMCAVLTISTRTFLTAQNFMNILTTESIIGIIAVGVMWCILSKGIDLSPGSVVALTSCISASLAQQYAYGASRLFPNLPDLPVVVAVLAALAAGTLIGLINGLLIAYTKIPAFIATLGTQLIARALAQLYTNAYPIPELKPEFKSIAQYNLFGAIPMVVVIFIVFAAVSGYMLTQTRFGSSIYAIGGNDQAARVAGINVEKISLRYILGVHFALRRAASFWQRARARAIPLSASTMSWTRLRRRPLAGRPIQVVYAGSPASLPAS